MQEKIFKWIKFLDEKPNQGSLIILFSSYTTKMATSTITYKGYFIVVFDEKNEYQDQAQASCCRGDVPTSSIKYWAYLPENLE